MKTEPTPIAEAIAGIYRFLALESHGDYGRDTQGRNCIWATGLPVVAPEPNTAVAS